MPFYFIQDANNRTRCIGEYETEDDVGIIVYAKNFFPDTTLVGSIPNILGFIYNETYEIIDDGRQQPPIQIITYENDPNDPSGAQIPVDPPVNIYSDIKVGAVQTSITKLKEFQKNVARNARVPLLQQLDYLYYIEAENIYNTGVFQKTPTMTEIFRKKNVLRDLPQTIDSLSTTDDVMNFVFPSSLDSL